MSRAITYTRVSSDDQGDNYSLPTQLAACRTYAEQHGMVIVAELSDIMTGSVLERPGLTKLRQIVGVGGCDVLIVYAQDRLTRSVAHMLLLRDELRAGGVALHAVGRGPSARSPFGGIWDSVQFGKEIYRYFVIVFLLSQCRHGGTSLASARRNPQMGGG